MFDGYELITVTMFDENGQIRSMSEHWRSSGVLKTTTYDYRARGVSAIEKVQYNHVSEFIVDPPQSYNASVYGASESLPPASYEFYRTLNTDYLYEGKILTGDTYFRNVGLNQTYLRHSYAFDKAMALTAVFGILGGFWSWVTNSTWKAIIVGFGISIAGGYLGSSWNPDLSHEQYKCQFKCNMVYRGTTYKMSEYYDYAVYIHTYDRLLKEHIYTFDMDNYSTYEQALYAYCSLANSWAGQAFEVKFLRGSNPNLALPVSGPVL